MTYCNISTVKHSTTNFEVGHTVAKSTVACVCEIQLTFEIKCYKMHFCGNNIAIV